MTSMPASRRARAMILAPRSCPSKPGLATTTRILPLDAASTAGRDATRDARAGDPPCPPSGGPRTPTGGSRRPPVERRGLHVAGRVLARRGHLPRPARSLREHAAALLPAHLAAAGLGRAVAAPGLGPGRRRLRGRAVVGRARGGRRPGGAARGRGACSGAL